MIDYAESDPTQASLGGGTQAQLGLTSPPPPVASPEVVPNPGLGQPGSPMPQTSPPQLGLGANAPDYNTLKQNAVGAYLANGGTQANVDQYFAANPTQDYGRLASDAAQWYTDPNQMPLMAQNNPDPNYYNNAQAAWQNQRNQDVGGYFGVQAPAAGQNYNFAPPGPVSPEAAPTPQTAGAPSPYPQSWIDTFNAQNPQVQAAIQARYAGMTPEQSMADWNATVASQYPAGTDPSAILSGATQPGPAIAPAPQGPAGAAGTLARAMQSAGTAAPQDTLANLARHKADETAFGAGSGTIYDPWLNPTDHINAQGQPVIPQGYGMGASTPVYGPDGKTVVAMRPGGMVKWDQPGGPGPSYTQAGQQSLSQPFTAGGQQFGGLQSLLDYMATSTPGQQGIKKQMEQRDAQGGTLEPGEGNLFDQFAKYLGQNVSTPPTGATPFTDWNPVGLLKLLQTAGILK